jgi:hypothetical protein
MGNSKPRVRSESDREIVESFTADLRLKEDQQRQKREQEFEKRQQEERELAHNIHNFCVATIMAGILVFTWIMGRRSSGSL